MSDFATEIIFRQSNSYYYPTLSPFFKKPLMASAYSPISTCDSGIELWNISKPISPVDSIGSSSSSECRWGPNMKYMNEKSSDSETNTESEFKYYKPKRASSLKSNRTPPGTPKSKAVRFADAFGLDLADIRHVFNLDMPPKIPASAVQDLVLDSDSDSTINDRLVVYKPNFEQPGAASDFLRRVRMHNIALENAFFDNNFLSGIIRVMNVTFEKRVTVRITFNDWKSHVDCTSQYVHDSNDGITDRFSFSFLLPGDCGITGQRIQFAVSYETPNSVTYWDNNFGQNYIYTSSNDSDIFSDFSK